jgi:hypothetical protein
MTGSPPQKQAVKSAPISGPEGEMYNARIFTVLPANVTWMAVSSKWVRPGTSSEWCTIQLRTRIAVLPPAASLSVRWQT